MRAVGYAIFGLIATPVVTHLLGWGLFGRRDTWSVGQGDSFLVFFVALWAAPLGSLYWALVAVAQARLERRISAGRFFLVALALFVVGLVVALLVADRRLG